MKYNSEFYKIMTSNKSIDNNVTSAEQMVPYILKLFPETKSVVDVGCGIGAWTSVFKKCGVKVLGLDGKWVDKKQLLIDNEEFLEFNIEKDDVQCIPYISNYSKYDMAVCLECAEHIDAKYADKLVEQLTSLSDIVIFSAAIPNQGGTHHVNEQWQSYWKHKFEQKGYKMIDLLRAPFADNSYVSYVYSQNMLIYINPEMKNDEYRKYFDIPVVVNLISPRSRIAHGTNTWRYLFFVQGQLIKAYVKKLLIMLGVLKHQ